MTKAERADLVRALRFARKTIRQMKRETNEFDYAREIAKKALRRLDRFMKGLEINERLH